MLENIKIEAKKKAKGSKASKWNGKNTTRHTAQHTWWGKTWPQNPEPLPMSDCFFAPGAWIPSEESWGEEEDAIASVGTNRIRLITCANTSILELRTCDQMSVLI